MFRISIIGFCLFFCFSTGAPAQAQSYFKQLKKREDALVLKRPKYELVKIKKTFPDRLNATIELPVKSDQQKTIASLHDYDSGEPLESCRTPCTLHLQPNEKYYLEYFKAGYWPRGRVVRSNKADRLLKFEMKMGVNYFEISKEHKKCRKEISEMNVNEQDTKPCYRHAAYMPPTAKASGHCKMVFDVTEKGRPINIKAESCTNEIFERPSKSAISWWRYFPQVSQGTKVTREGVQTKMTFRLRDEDGNLIPEPE